MGLREMLAERIHAEDIRIISRCMDSDDAKAELFALLTDPDKRTADNAAWVMSHFTKEQQMWLYDKQDLLIEEALRTDSITKRRIILSILEKQPFAPEAIRTDFLDFCFAQLADDEVPYGIRALCIKLAYKQSLPYPELLDELRLSLELIHPEALNPGLRCTRGKVLKALG